MPVMPIPSLEHLLDADYLSGLDDLSMDEVRARRSACQEAETALSYLRRIVQGRLDIVQADLDRRAGGEPGDLSALVEHLPEILGTEPRTATPGRLASLSAPNADATLTAELDEVLPPGTVTALPEIPEEDLRAIANRLVEIERDVSANRRALHERIDALQEEIVRRYRSGEATVDSLLK